MEMRLFLDGLQMVISCGCWGRQTFAPLFESRNRVDAPLASWKTPALYIAPPELTLSLFLELIKYSRRVEFSFEPAAKPGV